ncbi:hypothetical protein KCP91_12175 [Microvirga sp. SRT01]|uniref:Secreted protein n=1 Tax=Sphingomonas longa TaxID=2778730 RepID=A0ABS2D886_9SPHN|nr:MULTISPECIES: hypothetical protein [Alphaproteobacteria]MBM6577130.1 hypothetical protein [Sphingomonas sp. BT552]MBR7710174.1 hypothetical protein [Microvirga sp. SRT01]
MHKVLIVLSGIMLTTACGDTIDRSAAVDTTLPNSVAAIDEASMTGDMMVTDMNATDGFDTMTDNMTAVDAATSGSTIPDPPTADYQGSDETMMSGDEPDQTTDDLTDPQTVDTSGE